MKIAIMQPYFFPYIGYYKMMSDVDKFVIYDDVQYTKRGWINRNYLDSKSGPWMFSIPIEKSSIIEAISSKSIAAEYDRMKLARRIRQNYSFFSSPKKLSRIDEILAFETDNLFKYLENSLREFSIDLGLNPKKIIVSSEIGNFTGLKGQDKVLGICKEMGATEYLNPPSGRELYKTDVFEEHGIDLQFQKSISTEKRDSKWGVPYLSALHDFLISDQVILNEIESNEK